ncbi:MAG: leucine-rich repeat protein [Alphaproteobacteria bacterium]|nr:leucine-rich repeat protein [Alphaproteobacteria bacterium]
MKNKFFILGLVSTIALTTTAKADVNCYDCMTASNCPTDSGCQSKSNSYGSVYYRIDGSNMTVYGPTNDTTANVPSQSFFNYNAWTSILPPEVTSLDFSGNINTLGDRAFAGPNTNLTSVKLAGVQTVKQVAFQSAYQLTSVDLEGVNAIENYAFQSTGLTSVVLPESFFNADGTRRRTDIPDYAFFSTPITKIYCPQGTNCTNIYGQNYISENNVIRYTRDSETGVYTVGDKIYATALDLTNGVCTGTGSNQTCVSNPIECTTGLRDCQIRALAYQGDKCKTNAECGNLIDMVSNSQYACDSITACSNYAKTNNLSLANLSGGSGGAGGSSAGSGKRIYTVEEARQAVEAAGTETVNFRIRYK